MDIIVASLGYLTDAIEDMESHMAFLSEEDQAAFREIVTMAIPDHGRFYGDDKNNLVDRVLGILSDEVIVAGLDFSKLSEEQKNQIAKLFWIERDIYKTNKQAIEQMKKILGK